MRSTTPPPRKHLEACGLVWFTRPLDPQRLAPQAPDDLHTPPQSALHPVLKRPAITAIHPQIPEAGKAFLDWGQRLQHQSASDSIRQISGMDRCLNHQTLHIDEQVAFATLHMLGPLVAARPPFCVVFTNWLSRIAALGQGERHWHTRSRSHSAVWRRSHSSLRRHRRKYLPTVDQGGKSRGSAPLAAGMDPIQDGVEECAHVGGGWAPAWLGGRNEWGQDGPLAEHYERSDKRTTQRNGYRERTWGTGVGEIDLPIPSCAKARTTPVYSNHVDEQNKPCWPSFSRCILKESACAGWMICSKPWA